MRPEKPVEAIVAGLRHNVATEPLPITFVGFEDEQPVATATLKLREMTTHERLEHWLGTVYVVPSRRGRGLGTEIVSAAVGHARSLGIRTLHLFTIDQESLYLRLGWQPLERTDYRGDRVVIMSRNL